MKQLAVDPKAPEPQQLVEAAPKVPSGFFGEIVFHYRDGAVVLVDVRQTFKAP